MKQKPAHNIRSLPTESAVFYPESDGKPMAETDLHRDLMTDFIEMLKNYFHSHSDVYVSGNLLLYYEEGNPKKSVAPDVFVTKGIERKRRRTYLMWEEGKGPDFVLELSSGSTYHRDLTFKKELYASVLGVREYFIYDPEGQYLQPSLIGYRLRDDAFSDIESTSENRMFSDVLGLEIGEQNGELGLYDPQTERWLLTPTEQARAHQQAEAKAQEETAARQQAENKVQEEAAARQQAEAKAQEEAAARQQAENKVQEEAAARQQAQSRAERAESELAQLRAELEWLRSA